MQRILDNHYLAAIGAVVLMGKSDKVQMGETEQIVARCAANFMGRQMEN